MIERILHRALEAGFGAIKEDLSLLDDFLGASHLPANELARIKEEYAKHYHPTFRFGYGREDKKLPVIQITLGAERESTPFLGDQAGQVMGGIFDTATVTGALWESTYDLTVIANNGDVAIAVYALARDILFSQHDYFLKEGLLTFRMAGQDLQLDPTYMPASLFMRRLAFTCTSERDFTHRASRFDKAFKMSGIFLNDGSPEAASVFAGVTPVEEDA